MPLPSVAHTLLAIAHCIVLAILSCFCLASHLRLCADDGNAMMVVMVVVMVAMLMLMMVMRWWW